LIIAGKADESLERFLRSPPCEKFEMECWEAPNSLAATVVTA
jgi:hypothetical protein